MRGKNRGWTRALLVALTLAGVASLTASSGNGTDAIKARQHAMEQVYESMKTLAGIAKKQAPFEAAVVAKNGAAMAAALEKAEPQFPEGSASGDVETWALETVWTKPDEFRKLFQQAKQAATAMQEVTDEAAFPAALGQLGSTCKGCHETYRRPKQ